MSDCSRTPLTTGNRHGYACRCSCAGLTLSARCPRSPACGAGLPGDGGAAPVGRDAGQAARRGHHHHACAAQREGGDGQDAAVRGGCGMAARLRLGAAVCFHIAAPSNDILSRLRCHWLRVSLLLKSLRRAAQPLCCALSVSCARTHAVAAAIQIRRWGGPVDGARSFEIVLQEGRNRQIRRMCEAVGHKVVSLHRASFMGITASARSSRGNARMIACALTAVQPQRR
jgi:hypothetical protein